MLAPNLGANIGSFLSMFPYHRAFGQLAERVLDISQRPCRVIADDPAEADCRGDAKIDGQLIDLSIHLRGLDRAGHEFVARIAGVGVKIRPEVLQHAPGGILPDRQHHIANDQIRYLAGENFGVEHGKAGIVILAVCILRIIPGHDAAVGAGLVELDNLAAELIIKAEAGQRQLCFLLHSGSIHAAQHQDPLPLPRSVIAVPKGHSGDATVSQEVEAIVTDGIAVHITCQPVDDLFHLADVLAFAEDVTAVYKEIPVDIIARLQAPCTGRDRCFLSPVLRFRVKLFEGHLPVIVSSQCADFTGRELAELAGKLVSGFAENEAAIRPINIDCLIIVSIDIALIIGEQGVKVRIAPVSCAVRIFLVCGDDGAKQRAMRIQLDELRKGGPHLAVIRVKVCPAVDPERAVCAGREGMDFGAAVAAVENLCTVVQIFHIGLVNVVDELYAFSTVRVKPEKALGIGVIRNLIAVFVNVGILSAENTGSKIKCTA